VICGLEQHKSTSSNVLLNATRAIVGTPRGRPTGGLHITRRKIWANSVRTESAEEADFAQRLGNDLRKRLYVAGELTFNLGRKLASEARAGLRTLTERRRPWFNSRSRVSASSRPCCGVSRAEKAG
jgi:hypothetical protein